MSFFSTVSCAEIHESRSEGTSLDSGDSSVTVECAWSARWALMNDVVGNRRQDPESPALRASSASASPFGAGTIAKSGQRLVYEKAHVTINYSSQVEEDVYSESLEPQSEFILQDFKEFRWGSATGEPLKEGEAPGLLKQSLALVRTLYDVSSLPAVLLTGIGGVNDTAYTSSTLGLTFPIGTLMMSQPTLSRSITTFQTKGWTVGLKFLYQPEGWNKYWRADSQAWESIFIADGIEYESYPETDLSGVLFA